MLDDAIKWDLSAVSAADLNNMQDSWEYEAYGLREAAEGEVKARSQNAIVAGRKWQKTDPDAPDRLTEIEDWLLSIEDDKVISGMVEFITLSYWNRAGPDIP